ncbi:putative polyprenol reductase, partial [Ophiophagus hannah]
MLAVVWLALAACFFGALLVLQVPPLKASPGALSLHLAGIFQDLIRWFYHFYIVSVTWNGFLLLLFMQCVLFSWSFPSWLQDLLDILDGGKENRNIHHSENGTAFLSAFLVCFLVWVNSCRRLKECLHVSIYSGGTAPSLTVRWFHVLGLGMYCWASVHQHRCHVILANLRKDKSGKVSSLDHSIPFGDWFELVSSPHYFAEFLIYTSMAVTFGFYNLTWWLVVAYVFFNQAVSAVLCHEYYLNKFKHYPKFRK